MPSLKPLSHSFSIKFFHVAFLLIVAMCVAFFNLNLKTKITPFRVVVQHFATINLGTSCAHILEDNAGNRPIGYACIDPNPPG
jgi:hypothetical protein